MASQLGFQITVGTRVERRYYSGDLAASLQMVQIARQRILARFPTATFIVMDDDNPAWDITFGANAPALPTPKILQAWLQFKPNARAMDLFFAKLLGLETNDLIDPPLDS